MPVTHLPQVEAVNPEQAQIGEEQPSDRVVNTEFRAVTVLTTGQKRLLEPHSGA